MAFIKLAFLTRLPATKGKLTGTDSLPSYAHRCTSSWPNRLQGRTGRLDFMQAGAVPEHSLVSTTQPDKKERKRRAAVGRVQLHQPGAASSARPPIAFAAGHDR